MNIDLNEEKDLPDDVSSERQCQVVTDKLMTVTSSQVTKLEGDTNEIDALETFQVHYQHLPSQGNVVFWERFLHVRSIKVLLVENDDSTRHVVTALLRNCNYEVLDAANGFQAWMILEDLTNHVDIVLTEVVMPLLSGVGLLNKIMSHKTRKNIPVIMMSSHDSMGLVFKCLSKGAVDFLVKPIRKNELKILWQHVWRRCHSSSGSGSESGTQTQKSVKSKGSEKSVNSSSDGCENDQSNGLNTGDGSDDESGTQSSRTRQAVEVDSSQAVSPTDEIADCPESTCGRVILSNGENSVQKSLERECPQQKQLDIENVEKTTAERTMEPKCEDPSFVLSSREVPNRIGTTTNSNNDCKEASSEISLKRLRAEQGAGRFVQDDRFVLRRSEQSAFSRYNTSRNMDAAKRESVDNKSKATSAINGMNSELKCSQQQDNVLPDGVDPRNYSLCKSISGSNHGSIGPDGSNPATNTAGNNAESGVYQARENGYGYASGSGRENRLDEKSKLAIREAALIKFRQKRNERCFKKKVRYQNRKKLAEQRPRVKGQFVKQMGTESSNRSEGVARVQKIHLCPD